ncbi:hypothetical protein ALI144C_51020 [Actinosynnema sp. ALI-1.44]|nr:hypothetical protein ALI144C_51020 [Actinosynnema sp. ALI-1.44]
MGCRLPGGVCTPEGMWDLLVSGRDAMGEIPAGRWERYGDAVKAVTRFGGFLDDIAGFDAEFFGITPREATAMDPQQRIVLEVAWEALERAGLPPSSLAGTRTGVYVGASADDHARRQMEDLAGIDAWSGTGSALSIIANRVSYLLDLRGPSMTVDTACSSSLVAVHLAMKALRDGEIDVAVVAGVNLVLGPGLTANFDQAGAMAADGRSKPFDAAADGYGRAEGAVAVVLKRLQDAAGDPVLAVLRGSAVNSDGRSDGLMAPNPLAQKDMLLTACASAGVDPSQVDYVEAHGTGTPLGDSIEVSAIKAALGEGRGRPLLIGSAKGTFGHLEAAAGLVGLAKLVLSLSRGELLPSAQYANPNPRITFDTVRVVDTRQSWPEPRLGGVSSFGFGGTNAHVIVEQAAAREPVSASADLVVLFVSGRSEERLRDNASTIADWLAESQSSLVDVGYTLARRREHGPLRAAVVARDRAAAVDGLRAIAAGEVSENVVRGEVRDPGLVWVFPGQGSQWAGMARALLDEPVFAELEPLFLAEAGFSLRDALTSAALPEGIDRIQPLLFGVQIALAAVWRSYGVEPSAVIGHSMGEVAAAVVAGALTVEQGLRVITRRSRLMAGIAGAGAMGALELAAAEVEELITRYPGVSVAAYNAPGQTVVAGDAGQVADLVAEVAESGRLARLVKVDVASHSAQVDPLLPDLADALADIRGITPLVPFLSTVRDGEPVFDAEYWVANLRQPVRFAQAAAEHRAFLELSPHPLLGAALREVGAELVIGSLRRDVDDRVAFLGNLAALHCAGIDIDLTRLYPVGSVVVDVPVTRWRHVRYWREFAAAVSSVKHVELADPRGAHLVQVSLPDGLTEDSCRALLAECASAVGLPGVAPVDLVVTVTGPGVAQAILRPDGAGWAVDVHVRAGDGPFTRSATARLPAGLPEEWVHDLVWEPVPAPAPALPDATWLVVGGALAGVRTYAGEIPEDTRHVVSLAALDATDDPDDALRLTVETVALARELAARPEPPILHLVTRDAHTGNPAQAVMWGLARGIAVESPQVMGSVIDVGDREPTLELLAAEVYDTAQRQVAYRDGVRTVPRLRKVVGSAGSDLGPRALGPGAHLVTGASGSIGPRLLDTLVAAGARNLVTVTRSGLSADVAGRLRRAGVVLTDVRADVADEAAMTSLFARFGHDLPPLASVFHAALGGGMVGLADLDADAIADMFRAKVHGTALLSRLAATHAPPVFCLFSTVAGLLGSRGMTHYSAGSAYLDAVGGARRAAGAAAQVVAWGAWRDWMAGAGAHDRWVGTAEMGGLIERSGLVPMADELAIQAVPMIVGEDRAYTVVAAADWGLLAGSYGTHSAAGVLAELTGETREAGQEGNAVVAEPVGGLPERLRVAGPAARRRLLREHVRSVVAEVMGVGEVSALRTRVGFRELGMDSIMSVRVRRDLVASTGVDLRPTAVFDYSTVDDLAQHIGESFAEPAPADDEADLVRRLEERLGQLS